MTAPNQYVALAQLNLNEDHLPEETGSSFGDMEMVLAFTEWRST